MCVDLGWGWVGKGGRALPLIPRKSCRELGLALYRCSWEEPEEWLMVLVTGAMRAGEREGATGRPWGRAGIKCLEQCLGNCLHWGPNWLSLEVTYEVGSGS